ncbi:hypothetical protein IP84_04725, partial [beta proteobacterium AAP99]
SASQKHILLEAKEHITLAESGGAYLKLAGKDLELGAPNGFTVKAAKYVFAGPGSIGTALPSFSKSDLKYDQQFVLLLASGAAVANRKFEITYEDGRKVSGSTDSEGKTGIEQSLISERCSIKILPPDA